MKFERLGNIVHIKKGKKTNIIEVPDKGSVRVLQIDDLRNDKNLKYTNDKSGVFANEDDILIVWDGANAGTIGYGKTGYIGSTIALLRKIEQTRYSTSFIGKFLQSQFESLRSKTTGATIPHIDRKVLENLKIPVITYYDQLHIANILSRAENLIAQRKESILLLDEFSKSTFLEMFGEYFDKQIVKLETVASITSGLTKGKKYEGKQTKFVPYMRVANVQDGYLDLVEIKEIEATEDEIQRYDLKYGDLLLTEGGDPDKLGRGTIWKNEVENCIFQNHIFRVRAKSDKINPYFLSFLTGSTYGKKYFLKSAKQTTGIASINSTQLKSFPVIIPPLPLQTQFAHIVEKTEALKAQYQSSLQELEHLYGSLSQRAFKGELSAKDAEMLRAAEPQEDYIMKQ